MGYFNGKILQCSLEGNITLQGNVDSCFNDCYQGDFDTVPEIDMGTAGFDLMMNDYSGKIKIVGAQESNSISIGLASGQIELDSATVTACTIHVSGSGVLVDENGDHIPTGTWNTGVTIVNDLVNKDNVQEGLATKGDVWAR
jgi:formylmethanofuran dehydrogenase subunit C